MPKAAVHKDCNSIFRQNDIRLASEIALMKPISISKLGQCPSNSEFWIRIARSDARHVPTAMLQRKLIGHPNNYPKDVRQPRTSCLRMFAQKVFSPAI